VATPCPAGVRQPLTTAEVVKDWQNVLQIDRNEISIDCDDFRYQA
jgi:hypothetical protein